MLQGESLTPDIHRFPLPHAAEALLAAALKNPRNTKFFMLSESDLPLYSPHVMYLQVRPLSRCSGWGSMPGHAGHAWWQTPWTERAASPRASPLQLMSEHRSRVNACNTTAGWSLDFYRWGARLADALHTAYRPALLCGSIQHIPRALQQAACLLLFSACILSCPLWQMGGSHGDARPEEAPVAQELAGRAAQLPLHVTLLHRLLPR